MPWPSASAWRSSTSRIGWVAAAIGLATFVMVAVGVMLGRVLGAIAGKRAEVLGGLLLIGIGTAILVEHLQRRLSGAARRRPLVRLGGAEAFRRSSAAPITRQSPTRTSPWRAHSSSSA